MYLFKKSAKLIQHFKIKLNIFTQFVDEAKVRPWDYDEM